MSIYYKYDYLLKANSTIKNKLYEHICDFPLSFKSFIRTHLDKPNNRTHYDDLVTDIHGLTSQNVNVEYSQKIRQILFDILNSQFSNYGDIRQTFMTCNNILNDIDKMSCKREILEYLILEIIPFKFEGFQLYLRYGNNFIDGKYEDEYFITLIDCINSYLTDKPCFNTSELSALIFLLFDKIQLDPSKYAQIYVSYLSMTNKCDMSLQHDLEKFINEDMLYVIGLIPDDILRYTGIKLKKMANKKYSNHEYKPFQLKLLSESYANYQIFGDNIFESGNLSDIYKIRSLEEDINDYVNINTNFTISESALSFLKYQYKDNKHAIIRNKNQNNTRHIFEYDNQNYLLFESDNCPNEILGISLKSNQGERNLIRIEMDEASYKFIVGGCLK